jgi:hypothetical protein
MITPKKKKKGEAQSLTNKILNDQNVRKKNII